MTTVGYVAITMLIAGLAAVIVLLLILLRRPAAVRTDSDALAELRGQLAQLVEQSGALQQTVATQMHETEGRLGQRLEKSMRDQNERTNRSLTGQRRDMRIRL